MCLFLSQSKVVPHNVHCKWQDCFQFLLKVVPQESGIDAGMVTARWPAGISHASICQADPPRLISMPTTNNRLLTKESLHFAPAKSPIGSCTTGRLQFIQFSHRQTVAVSQSPRSDGLSRRLWIVRKADAFSFFSTTEQQRPYLCHYILVNVTLGPGSWNLGPAFGNLNISLMVTSQ